MKTIGVIAKDNIPEILNSVEVVRKWAADNSYQLNFEQLSSKILGRSENGLPIEEFARHSEIIVTLGGDGTLIRVARYAALNGAVIVGVNFGKLGFLTETLPAELSDVLDSVKSGKSKVSERSMITAEVWRQGKQIFSAPALNDAVLLKSSKNTLIDLDLNIGDEEMMRLRADGLIFSTPTGSTAYSLAAGGSIAFPTLNVLLITPICPHSLTVRPLIMPLNSVYSVNIPEHAAQLVLSMDGQEYISLLPFDKIIVKEATSRVKIVRSPKRNYFEILRTKLNWAVSNKGG